jgi:putative methionine-R-sulfoxide reductase with GAF domain
MSTRGEGTQATEDRLRNIESLTDSALANLDFDDLLNELLERVREVLNADTAAVLLLEPSADYLVARAARGLEEEVHQGTRVPLRKGFAGRIAAEQSPVVLDHVTDQNVVNPVLLEKGVHSMLGVPLLSSGRSIGVLHVGTLSPRKFTPEDVNLLQMAADRIALATQARISTTERTAALALQRSLLPGRLPSVPGLDLAARYVPGEEGGVGGDWYDLFTLPSGQLCFAMGDVAGRGLEAAMVMGRLRNSLRAHALNVEDPADVLNRMDRQLQHFEPSCMATVLYGVFDKSLERVRLSLAGHLPPVLADPDRGAVLVDAPVDPPLGVDADRPRRTATAEIRPGNLLCLYTDGLVERRDTALDARLQHLRHSIIVGPAETVCAVIMSRMVGTYDSDDDVALLVIRREPLHGQV